MHECTCLLKLLYFSHTAWLQLPFIKSRVEGLRDMTLAPQYDPATEGRNNLSFQTPSTTSPPPALFFSHFKFLPWSLIRTKSYRLTQGPCRDADAQQMHSPDQVRVSRSASLAEGKLCSPQQPRRPLGSRQGWLLERSHRSFSLP